MMSISFYMDWKLEEEILNYLADHVRSISPSKDPESIIETALTASNYLEERHSEIFHDKPFQSFKVKLMSTSFAAFNYGGGDCGSYTLFLARLLKNMGYKVKIVQLKVNGVWGGHITLGIENGNKLLLVDPLFNCSFRDSSNHLSDIHTVASNWGYYSKNLPKEYKSEYDYQSGWRYTNWDKFGFISRGIYNTGVFIFGKSRMDNLSVHYYYLGLSKIYFISSFLGFLLFILNPIRHLLKHRKLLAKKLQRKTEIKGGDYIEPLTHSA